MRTIIATTAISLALTCNPSQAAERDLNSHMIRAYKMLHADKDRAMQGYNLNKYFTKNLDYGPMQGAIKAATPIRATDSKGNFLEPTATHKTMCNAAVMETIVEAINLYASDHAGWTPGSVIPVDSWNKKGFAGLKSHLFTEDLTDYHPLGPLKAKARKEKKKFEIQPSLLKEIEDFHSDLGMAFALEKFGIGRKVDFKAAKPGDIMTFDRTDDSIEGPKYSGHSVVFLGYVTRDQSLTPKYDANEVVGFKYFSSQGGPTKGTGGLSEKWAYFKGFCPIRINYSLPVTEGSRGCKDRIDNAENRAKRPLEKAGQSTDCCLNSPTHKFGPRVGRVHAPEQWKYGASQPAMQKRHEALMKRIAEFVKGREEASLRVSLLAKGAVAVESRSPQLAKAYIDVMSRSVGIDARAVARGENVPAVSVRQANQLERVTPQRIKVAANRTVTTLVRDDLAKQVRDNVEKTINDLKAGDAEAIESARIDSRHVD